MKRFKIGLKVFDGRAENSDVSGAKLGLELCAREAGELGGLPEREAAGVEEATRNLGARFGLGQAGLLKHVVWNYQGH